MTPGQRKIVQMALDFWSEREIPGNQGFEDAKFEQLMKETGWAKGQAWCVYFCELTLRQAGYTKHADAMSASAVTFYRDAAKHPELFTITQEPEPGDLVVWQYYARGKAQWTGHAGIAVRNYPSQIIAIEGNTNSEGGREGIEVALSIRSKDRTNTDGLRLLGFVRTK